MNPVVTALLGALAGLLVGALAVALGIRRRMPEDPVPTELPPEELDAIVQALRSGAAVVGANDELVACNDPARTLGLVKGTRIGIPAVHDVVRGVRTDGELAAVNVELSRGSRRPSLQLAVRVVPLPDRRVLVVADDRAPALRVQASSRDFMANATHELKTPIGAISLLAEAAGQASDDPDAVARFTAKIGAEAARLDMLVAQIITLSKLQGADPRSGSEPIDIDALVEGVLARYRVLAVGRSIELTSAGASGLAILGDSAQVETALGNLVQNAIAYSDAHARVAVTARLEPSEDGDVVALAVSDNGIGIAADEQARIFERFYRVDYARSRATGGTGLGLTIVKEIAEGHGGQISLWSKAGSGSTFTLRLPAATASGGDR